MCLSLGDRILSSADGNQDRSAPRSGYETIIRLRTLESGFFEKCCASGRWRREVKAKRSPKKRLQVSAYLTKRVLTQKLNAREFVTRPRRRPHRRLFQRWPVPSS